VIGGFSLVGWGVGVGVGPGVTVAEVVGIGTLLGERDCLASNENTPVMMADTMPPPAPIRAARTISLILPGGFVPGGCAVRNEFSSFLFQVRHYALYMFEYRMRRGRSHNSPKAT
jgi:hypothetical protein